MLRPSIRPFAMSRGFRVWVEYGSIEYSEVSQPPVTPCSFIQRGTFSSMVTPQITRVLPTVTSTEPSAYGAMPRSKPTGRNWSPVRPSIRSMAAKLNRARALVIEEFWLTTIGIHKGNACISSRLRLQTRGLDSYPRNGLLSHLMNWFAQIGFAD